MDTEATPLLLSSSTKLLSSYRTSAYCYAIIAAVGGFVCGYDTGSISSIIALPYFQRRFFIHGSLAHYESMLLASYLITSMCGAFSSGFFCGTI
jgi:uncharacterized membrane protein (UPF0136 family)